MKTENLLNLMISQFSNSESKPVINNLVTFLFSKFFESSCINIHQYTFLNSQIESIHYVSEY